MNTELQELGTKFILPLKLQYFAEAGSTGDDTSSTEEDDSDDEEDDDTDEDDDKEDDSEDDDDTKKKDKKDKKDDKKTKTYTQNEVDRIIKNRLARELKKQAKAKDKDTKTTKVAKDTKVETKGDDGATNKLLEQMAKIQEKLVQSEIKSALVTSGIDPDKVGKAMKLIDMDNILDENDEPDMKLLRREVKEIIKEFPNLKKATSSGGFKVGSGDGGKVDTKVNSELSSIFGNMIKK